MFHGDTGRNWWTDKTMTLVVCCDGRAGLSMEHSPCDMMTPCRMAEYFVQWYVPKDTCMVTRVSEAAAAANAVRFHVTVDAP